MRLRRPPRRLDDRLVAPRSLAIWLVAAAARNRSVLSTPRRPYDPAAGVATSPPRCPDPIRGRGDATRPHRRVRYGSLDYDAADSYPYDNDRRLSEGDDSVYRPTRAFTIEDAMQDVESVDVRDVLRPPEEA